MAHEMQVFKSKEFGEIRIATVNGEPWFVGKDVALSLGYSNPLKAIRDHIDHEDKTVNESFTVNGTNVILINESGLYSLVLSSKLPTAKKFKRWVTSEVLPTIRKHGAYMTNDALHRAITEPDFLIRLATELKQEQEARRLAEKKIEQDKPKVLFADAVEISESDCTVGTLAKILKQNGIEMGQNRLYEWLRSHGYLHKTGMDRNRPLQKYVEQGLFRVRESHRGSGDSILTFFTTYVTGKGQQYFVNLFLKDKH